MSALPVVNGLDPFGFPVKSIVAAQPLQYTASELSQISGAIQDSAADIVPGSSQGSHSPTPQTGLFGLLGDVDKAIPALGALDDLFDLNPNTSGSLTATDGPAAGIAAGLAFITDIPRVATTLLGLILIIAGVFALSRGPAVQIVGAFKNSVTTS